MSYAERLGAIEARLDKLERPEPIDSDEWHIEILLMRNSGKEYSWSSNVLPKDVLGLCIAMQYLLDAVGASELTELILALSALPTPQFDYEGYPMLSRRRKAE